MICSKPILDRLVALIADAIMDKVSQHVYAAINHDLETKNKEVEALQKKLQSLENDLTHVKEAHEEQDSRSS